MKPGMKVEILPDAHAVARRGAQHIAALARDAVQRNGRFVMALSGGTDPWESFRILAGEDVPWQGVHVFQVDERVAPTGDAERNYTHLLENLLDRVPLQPDQIHPMPVENPQLEQAALHYGEELRRIAGVPPVIDLVHLGLGADGHTASLVPGDPVLEEHDADVGLTGVYRGCRRMTLTYPAINRARNLLWMVSGEPKAQALARLLEGDASVPAGRVNPARALVLADQATAKDLPPR
jgi:6-phosphogluconolactonase